LEARRSGGAATARRQALRVGPCARAASRAERRCGGSGGGGDDDDGDEMDGGGGDGKFGADPGAAS